ncbi:hypothetical protein FRB94_006363 [Tulasnella sp. JGI-2019a]|nr:hypothetical protein FRB93_001900 [Tulasnella sp. JGI-2019a]KAG8999229.1 hypothetical protein FRB94_006363 [Tulasnella sp. JGI-2019a]
MLQHDPHTKILRVAGVDAVVDQGDIYALSLGLGRFTERIWQESHGERTFTTMSSGSNKGATWAATTDANMEADGREGGSDGAHLQVGDDDGHNDTKLELQRCLIYAAHK